MVSPNTGARHHGQGTPGSHFLPRLKKIVPKHYAPPVAALPITSGGTTVIAKGGQTPPDHVGAPLVHSLSFATPLAVPATAMNSVSSLSQSTKEASKTSAGKRDGPSIAKLSEKRMKSDPFDSEAGSNYAPDKEDKEADYVPNTNKASSNIMDGKAWEHGNTAKPSFGMSPKTMSGTIALHALHAFAKTQSPRSSRGPSSQFSPRTSETDSKLTSLTFAG
jgi:hypothetical protein